MSTAPTRDRLVNALGPVVATHDLELEEVDVTPAGRRRLVRVIVDKDGGVTLDEISDVTRAVARHLDGTDVMDEQPYTLEVTSPGIDRPLTEARHWRRNIGRLVAVTSPAAGSLIGRIREASDHSARIEVDGTEQDVDYADVAKALVQVEFNRKED